MGFEHLEKQRVARGVKRSNRADEETQVNEETSKRFREAEEEDSDGDARMNVEEDASNLTPEEKKAALNARINAALPE